jgi:hypothetical protein
MNWAIEGLSDHNIVEIEYDIKCGTSNIEICTDYYAEINTCKIVAYDGHSGSSTQIIGEVGGTGEKLKFKFSCDIERDAQSLMSALKNVYNFDARLGRFSDDIKETMKELHDLAVRYNIVITELRITN